MSKTFASASPPSYTWNCILEFDKDISKELSNDELVGLAKQGYDEIDGHSLQQAKDTFLSKD